MMDSPPPTQAEVNDKQLSPPEVSSPLQSAWQSYYLVCVHIRVCPVETRVENMAGKVRNSHQDHFNLEERLYSKRPGEPRKPT